MMGDSKVCKLNASFALFVVSWRQRPDAGHHPRRRCRGAQVTEPGAAHQHNQLNDSTPEPLRPHGRSSAPKRSEHFPTLLHGRKGFVIPTKPFVKIGITKIFCYNNKMFSSINETFGCCSKIVGCSNKKFICCL